MPVLKLLYHYTKYDKIYLKKNLLLILDLLETAEIDGIDLPHFDKSFLGAHGNPNLKVAKTPCK